MNDEQKKAASDKTRAHWIRCRAVATRCGVRAGEVNEVWSQIKDYAEDTDKVQAIILERRRKQRERYRDQHNPARKRDKPKNLTQAIRVMMWALDTIDDLDLAKQAFDKAYEAVTDGA